MEDSFEENLLPSGDFQDELLLLLNDNNNHSTTLNLVNNKNKRNLFEFNSNKEEEEDLIKDIKLVNNNNNNNNNKSLNTEKEEEKEKEIESNLLTKKLIKNYTGQEDYTNEKFYEPTGFGQGGLFMANKRRKLQVQHNALLEDGKHEDRPQIFKGLKLYINGLTDTMGLRQLTELLVQYGGIRIDFLDRKQSITHIIASILTPKKFEEFNSYKVVTPEWLTDSVKVLKLLPWNDYSTFDKYQKSSDGTHKGINDTDRMGTQVAQQKLFGFGISKGVVMSRSEGGGGTKGKEVSSNQGSTVASSSGIKKLSVESKKKPEVTPIITNDYSLFQTTTLSTKNSAPTTPNSKSTSTLSSSTTSPIKPTTDDMPHHYLPSIPNQFGDSNWSDSAWLKENTALNPNFLKTYFDQSRLSHLSMWKQELITLAHTLQEPRSTTSFDSSSSSSKGKNKKLQRDESRIVMHVDFDCFFVSAGLTSRPKLIGRPVAVCHTDGNMERSTSEIASCSYEARAKGVVNGMSFGRAQESCPDIIAIPFEFDLYKSISLKLYNILLSHATFLQAVSVDECLIEVDLPSSSIYSTSNDPALELAHRIRAEIKLATGCEISIGVSYNVLLAKLATRKAKPASAFHLIKEEVLNFLIDLEVDSLPGIGPAIRSDLKEKLNVETVGELRKCTERELKDAVGETKGSTFFGYARGIDDRELEGKKERKSVEVAVNYAIRFTENSQVKTFLYDLAGFLTERLQKENLYAQSLTLTIKKRRPDAPIIAPKFLGHGSCSTHSSTLPIGIGTDDKIIFGNLAWKLMLGLKIEPDQMRGVALSAGKVKLVDFGGNGKGKGKASQGMLGFGRVEKPGTSSGIKKKEVKEVNAVAGPSKLESTTTMTTTTKKIPVLSTSTTLRKDPSVIIIDDTDSEPSSPPSKLPPPPSPKKKSKKGSKEIKKMIPAMFGTKSSRNLVTQFPTASQVSDSELKLMGINVEFYRAVPEEDQKDLIENARKSSKALHFQQISNNNNDGGQTILRGKSSKPSTSSNIGKSKSVEPSLPPPSPPMEITDESITKLGFVPSEFRLIPSPIQRDFMKNLKKAQKSLAVAGDRPAENTRVQSRLINFIDFQPDPLPRFINKTDLDEIRLAIESWFENWKDQVPVEIDVDQFIDYLEKLVDVKNVGKGRDLFKVKSLLDWWEYLLLEEFGKMEDCTTRVAISWWESVKGAKERIRYFVEKEFGTGVLLI